MVGTDHQVVMINRGRLTFAQTVYVSGFSAWDLVSGDLEGDEDSDVVLATLGSSSTGDMSILRNRGGGTFRSIRFSAGFNPHDAAIDDFDGDGKADIAVAKKPVPPNGSRMLIVSSRSPS
jgi:FG-GAP-like repeat